MNIMPQQPLVSIIVPCYNHQDYIQACIESIIGQSYPNLEFIIIDDGSKDSSAEKIKALENQCKARFSRFEFRVRPNKGLSATLNEGLAWIKGEYFCVIASDDLMTADKVAIQIRYALKNPEITSIYGSVQLIDEHGDLRQKKQLDYQEYGFDEIFLNRFTLYAPTQMHKTKDFLSLGGFNEQTKIEDWDILLRLAKANKKIVCVPELLAYYRMHANNTFNQHDLMLRELLKIIQLYREEPLFKLARLNILRINKLKPMKKVNKLHYYLLKLTYALYHYGLKLSLKK
ncbi:MAG: glycosyltransferase [Moraxellaceae bacterium]|nr:MAG: glycosyltransferase [Moraxellaceae bacterium]